MHRQMQGSNSGVVAVAVDLCALCSSPYDYQVKDAEKKLTAQCAGDFTLLEEGTHVSPSNAVYVAPLGYGAVASEIQQKTYYWVARCSAPTSPAATGEIIRGGDPPRHEESDPPRDGAQRGWR